MDGLRSALALTPCVFLVMRELITARTRAGLTQSELAERMHTTQSTIARLEENRGLSPTIFPCPLLFSLLFSLFSELRFDVHRAMQHPDDTHQTEFLEEKHDVVAIGT